MSDRLSTIFITIVLFVAGLLVGIWTQRSKPVPPPPMALMGEVPQVLGEIPHRHHHYFHIGDESRVDPELMRRRLEELEPQIRAFQTNVSNIEGDFRKQLNLVLTPAQRTELANMISEHHVRHSDGPMPGCAGELGRPLVPLVIYRPLLDRMTERLKLSSSQHDQVEALLRQRRTQFLSFVDDNPPPTFRLRELFANSENMPNASVPTPSR